ncbi:lumenal Hsp70 protein [Rhodotorula toruloides]
MPLHSRPRHPSLVVLLAALVSALFLTSASAASLLAIDYGTESFKASVVKPGIPFDVLLTKEGKRKAPSIVTFRGEERLVGGEAQSLATRFPQDTLSSVKLLLAHPPSHAQSQLHSSLFSIPQTTTSRNSPALQSSKLSVPVEEALAYQFVYAKEMAEEQAKEPVREAVVTVPGWFADGERKAVVDAAEIAGLRVVGLVNDGSAAAVNYAMSRTFPPEPSYHLIYDLGSGSLRVTLVSLRSAMLPDPLSLAETPQLKNVTSIEVHGFGYDLEVGGYVFDRAVRDLLVEAFEQTTGKQLEGGKKVTDDKRAMAKLLREASRVKQVLSANTAAMARIEGLIDDLDFRTEITRSALESRASSLLPHLTDPIQRALDSASLPLSSVESVILVGGSSRVPFVQQAVADKVGEEKIAKNVNADEAAVLGAALYGAGITRGFRTKDIRVRDLVPFGIDVAYGAERKEGADSRIITTHLFPPNSATSSKKTLTLRKTTDFSLDFSYASSPSSPSAPSGYLFSTHLKGISAATANLTAEQLVNATVKVGVEVDASGLVRVGKAELVLREVEEEEEEAKKEGVTDKLKGLFNKFSSGKNATASSSSSSAAAEETAASKEELTDDEKRQLDEMIRRSQLPPAKIRLAVETSKGVTGMGSEEKMELKKRLRDAKTALTRKRAHEEARNVLESYVYRVRDLLSHNEAFVAASVESERKAVKEAMERTAEWLWDEGEGAETKVLKEKKRDLEKLVKHILSRSTEASERPAAVSSLRDQLSKSSSFLSTARADSAALAKSDPSAPQRFTGDELDSLDKLVRETQAWLDDAVKRQEKVKAYEDPAFKVVEVEKRAKEVERETAKLEKKKMPRRKKAVPAAAATVEEETEKEKEKAQESPKEEGGHKKDEL